METNTPTTADHALRPQRFRDYTGQPALIEQLELAAAAARARGDVLEHILIDGQPGLGKTTIAHIIANEMGAKMIPLNAAGVDNPLDFVGLFANVRSGDVLFVDEIHRLPPKVEEFLYPAMEDFRLEFQMGKGGDAFPAKIKLPKFTLIGATTMPGMITAPMRARFGLQFTLEPYAVGDIANIITMNAAKLRVGATADAVWTIAERSRGTPRVANRLLRRCRDYATLRNNGKIDSGVVDAVMGMLGIDALGLDARDRKYLAAIIDRHGGGPVGVEAVASGIGEDPQTLVDVAEPYLMRCGLLLRTRRGRQVTPKAYQHLGREMLPAGMPLMQPAAELARA